MYKASVDEIEIKSLDRTPPQQASQQLKERVDLLAHGGKLKITGTDFNEVSRRFSQREFNIPTLNDILSGHQSFTTIDSRCDELINLGLVISVKKIEGLQYYIEAVRN